MARRRRRSGMRVLATTLMAVIMLMLIGIIGSVVYYVLHLNSAKGSWVRYYDCTDEVAMNIALWMSDIEGTNTDAQWVKSHTEKLELPIVFELQTEGLTGGKYSVYVDEASYRDCEGRVKSLAANCLTDIITDKLIENGYKDNMTTDETSVLINEILGCSMEDYLANNGLSFIDSYDSINGKYFREGEYKLNLHYITRTDSTDSVKERYLTDEDKLILPEQGVVYERLVSK